MKYIFLHHKISKPYLKLLSKYILIVLGIIFSLKHSNAQVAYRNNLIYAQTFQNGFGSVINNYPNCIGATLFSPSQSFGDLDHPPIPTPDMETGATITDESFDIGGTRATCLSFDGAGGSLLLLTSFNNNQPEKLQGFYFEIGHVTMDGRFVNNSKATFTVNIYGPSVGLQVNLTPYADWNKFYIPIPASLNFIQGKKYSFSIKANSNEPNVSSVFRVDDLALIGTLSCQQSVKLGNYVWEDANGNASVDAGELPFAGVKLALYADDGDGVFEPLSNINHYENGKDAVVATTTTDVTGHYEFITAPGNYFVAVLSENFSSTGVLVAHKPTTGAAVTGNSDLDNKDHAIRRSSYALNGVASDLITLSVGGEPTNDGDDANGNMTIDFGFLPADVVGVGNLVWLETVEDGIFNPADGEGGIDGVKVELYEDTDNSGTFSVGDVLTAQTTTSGGGIYNFKSLLPGNYVIVLPASNYAENGGALNGLKVTTGLNPIPDPDNNVDNDNNGLLSNYKVVSQAITLSLGGEPNTDGDGANGNLTVDFGFANPICSRAFNAKSNAELQVFEGTTLVKTVTLQSSIMGSTTHSLVDIEEGPGNTVYAIVQGVFPDEGDYNKQFHLIKYNLSDGAATVVYSDDRSENGMSRNLRSLAIGKGKVFILKSDNIGTYPSNSFKFITYDIASNTISSSSEIVFQDPYYHAKPTFNYTYLEYYKGKLYTSAYEYSSYVGYLMSFPTDGSFTPSISNVGYSFSYPSFMTIRQDTIFRYTSDTYANVDVFKASDLSAITPFTQTNSLSVFAYNQVYSYNGGWLGSNTYTNDLSFSQNTKIWPQYSDWQNISNTVRTNTGAYWAKNCESTSSSGPGGILSLGNYIWKDDNNNGMVDSGETPIANVTVDLFVDNGDGIYNTTNDALVQSTTTDGSGIYQFTELPADNYFVRVNPSNFGSGNPLQGLITSTGFTISNDDLDNNDHGIDSQDPNQFGIVSKVITLSENGEPDASIDGDDSNGNQTIDFGFYNPPSILNLGNLVWNDKNNNLFVDAGEQPIADVVLDLYLDFNGNGMLDNFDQKVGSEITDAAGHYLFSNLAAGDYIVFVPASNYGIGKPLNGMINSIRFTGGNFNIDNADHGVEEIVADQTVTGVASTIITLANGTEPTTDGDDANGNLTMDFGFFVPLNLGNLVWNDPNNNGMKDAGELPVSNVLVDLIVDDGDGVFDVNKDLYWLSDSTDINGLYGFNQLGSGKYFVRIPFDNFESGSVLNNLYSSNGNVGGDSDQNDKDHGINDAAFLTKGIFSGIVNLEANTEPATGVDSDGSNGNLTIDFGFTTQNSNVCSINISATPSQCNTTTNQYSVTGSLTFSNPPTTGTLNVSIGSVTQSFSAPFVSPLPYTLSGLTADGASHTVTTSFSADANCSNTQSYTAPNSCMVNPCSIALTATPSLCNTTTNQYNISGSLTFSNPPTSGTLSVSIGSVSQSFNAPFVSPLNYTLSGLTADGASHTVTTSFSANANCSNTQSYTAPNSCSCSNNQNTICPGESYTLTAEAGFSNYQWYTINGTNETAIPNANSQTYIVTTTGTYKWKATNSNNCPLEACCNYLFTTGNCQSCSITNAGLTIMNCDYFGTLSNTTDDVYSFTINPTGSLLSTSYTINGLPDGTKTGNYGTIKTFGPYLISNGTLNLSIVDNIDNNCKLNFSVTPPLPCSNCNVAPPVLTVTDNICPSRTGTINLVQGCGAGSFIQYSINNGKSWMTTKPFYSPTSMTILARCVNNSDTSCKSNIVTITTNPKKCPPSTGSECSLLANATIDPCNNNGTDDVATDDYFTIQVSATVTNGGSSNKYEVEIGADPLTGIGGNVLNSGGTNYGSPVTVGNTKIFKADGTTSYQIIIRDINNNNCFQSINILPLAPCSIAPPKSPCYPVPCVPINIIKN